MRSYFGVFLLVSAVAGGCKSTVSVTSGAGGAGGAGSSHGTGTLSTNASSSTGIDPKLCDKFCTAVGTCVNNCQGECKAYMQPPCEDAGANLVACLTSNYNAMTCQPGDCSGATTAFSMCHQTVPQQCGVNANSGNATHCVTTSECQDGEERVICDGNNGQAVCTCYLNSIMIALCQRPSSDLYADMVCSPQSGCCSHFFGS